MADDIGTLTAKLRSADADERAAAAEQLCHAGGAAAAAALDLVQACGDADDRVREWAVAALEDLGPPPAELTGQLIDLVADRDPLVAYWATTLLGRVGQDAATAVPALVKCLESAADLSVRQRAAWALGKIGPAATAARDALGRAAGDADPRLARLAAEAIAAIGR